MDKSDTDLFDFDPWELSDEEDEQPTVTNPYDKGYDISKFYTKSTNDHDHSANVRFRMPPHLYAAICDIVHSGRIPQYRSPQDFLRNWSYHGIMYECMERIPTPRMEAALRIEATRMERQRLADEDAMYAADVEDYRVVFQASARLRNWRSLAEHIATAERALDDMPEPWRGQLGDLIADARRDLDRG